MDREVSFGAATFWALASVVVPIVGFLLAAAGFEETQWFGFVGPFVFFVWPIGAFIALALGLRRMMRESSIQGAVEAIVGAFSGITFIVLLFAGEWP